MNPTPPAKQEIKQGDFVIYAGSRYEVADTSSPTLVGIYDEPPNKHVDYVRRENVMTVPDSMRTRAERTAQTLGLITQYLTTGGLFNPEMADHDKVRDLLINCRDEIVRFRDMNARRCIDYIDRICEVCGHQKGEDSEDCANCLKAELGAAKQECHFASLTLTDKDEELDIMRRALEHIRTKTHCAAKAGPAAIPALEDAWNEFDLISVSAGEALAECARFNIITE